jgi:hypothetical protein
MKTFRVNLPRAAEISREERIEADYLTLTDGHLCFRNLSPRGGYPETVRIFAPGCWLDVETIAETILPPLPSVGDRFAHLDHVGDDLLQTAPH